ncbi:hypothetical protein CF651_11435 [Paenibacillus rigui]|uniref:Uncharacterized protein n=1 Tax=Paenibacillus rigui TaxID=554312 RepID=A0A229UQY0_9BACL|nr:hypothetical protein CF651_11435 [Paenibacillus rigui]
MSVFFISPDPFHRFHDHDHVHVRARAHVHVRSDGKDGGDTRKDDKHKDGNYTDDSMGDTGAGDVGGGASTVDDAFHNVEGIVGKSVYFEAFAIVPFHFRFDMNTSITYA